MPEAAIEVTEARSCTVSVKADELLIRVQRVAVVVRRQRVLSSVQRGHCQDRYAIRIQRSRAKHGRAVVEDHRARRRIRAAVAYRRRQRYRLRRQRRVRIRNQRRRRSLLHRLRQSRRSRRTIVVITGILRHQDVLARSERRRGEDRRAAVQAHRSQDHRHRP